MAELDDDGFVLESTNPERRATPTSVAAHSLYEQADPFTVHEPEGTLDLSNARYEAVDDRRCVLTSGSDSLDAIALHLALLDVPFTPIEPPELRDRCQALAARLLQAAARY